MMKAGQSTFEERVSRINGGAPRNAEDVVPMQKTRARGHADGKKRRFHFDMLVAGGIAGGVAGTLFAQNIGLLFLMSLEWPMIYGLAVADYELAAYMAACLIAPIGFLWSLILGRGSKRGLQFWTAYGLGVLAANHVEGRYVVEYVAIPAFWDYVGTYTSAKDIVNDAVATQPQF
ncbi:hypothetical protein [uncultured Tateyamaria sp.]|uniref:hypothetical protein n=1 Tax=uncultured Tateyamaria sp. TaxID=455651 RepID=UPI002626975D|nr:hypothetical protein [uncultured Tateyamaria sp.]